MAETVRCRVCNEMLPTEALLVYHDMPAAAQGFPDAGTLSADRGQDLKVVQCAGCGLVQLPSEPVPYFREVIRAAAFSPEMGEFRRHQFADWQTRYDLAGKPLLEVGCGRGEYLALLREAGIDAHGIEHAAEAVQACQAAGLPVERAFLDRPGQTLAAAPFAAFVSLNFMEHWPAPVASLRAIRDQLVENGLGFVEVPNFDMMLAEGQYAEFISDHLSYFTRDTLRLALQMAGFEVLECQAVWHDYILSAVIRRRPSTAIEGLIERRRQITDALRDFIGRYPPGSVAVWGAGHQALATVALTGIASGIRYIVDSAPFKQGKFTPATHLPIVSPETLRNDPVQAVIVMAASYSDEVAGTIRQRYPADLGLAILRNDGLEIRE